MPMGMGFYEWRYESASPTLQLIVQSVFWSFALKAEGDQKHLALGQNAEITVLLAVLLFYF